MDAIRIESLTKKYKDVVAVDNLCLTVKSGELFSLLGDAVIIGLNQENPVESRVCTDLVLYFLTCKWWRLGRRRNNQNRTPYESWSVPGCPLEAGFKKVRGDIRYAIGL